MAPPAVAQEVICALRQEIARIEGTLPERLAPAGESPEATILRRRGLPERPALSTGVARFDAAIGGLPSAGLVELHGEASRDSAAVAGFTLGLVSRLTEMAGLPLLWIGTSGLFREAGWPYLPGLAERYGIQEDRMLLAEAEKLLDVLWIAEEAASLGRLAAIIIELHGNPKQLDLVATQRLHRRSSAAGRPLFLLRHVGRAEPTAAPLRLLVGPAPAGLRSTIGGPLEGSIGPPAFRVAIDKSRSSAPAAFTLEWNRETRSFEERDHVFIATTNPGALAAAPADGPDFTSTVRKLLAFPSAPGNTAAGDQPSRGQHAAHSRSGRAR